ncbi:flavin-containing monooxygenase 5-like [Gigantopelta aegis]|uniref:flavin-containing monooxygenase 5-like n=1 Tax=Gigantopelta aegis TaxID=1735272 RepID=UPI001B88D182|nr:flavin-containing monooxygenase 5-like [Gigantopelta aegis]
MKNVAIIGAGCSGLTAIKACLEENLFPVCFEMSNKIGGLWNYSDDVEDERASIYKNLVINTSKEMMAFSDFPIPEDFPPFMPHDLVLKYLFLYVESFGLKKYIQFDTHVRYITRAPDYAESGRWVITVQKKGCESKSQVFDGVMVCTGHHTVPYTPSFVGLERFKGVTFHSHKYKDSSKFAGRRVLIVGMGNSAVDIAVDLCKVTSKLLISTRRGAWVISRTGLWGIPNDFLANNRFIFTLPLCLLQWCVEKQTNLRLDHTIYGLLPKHRLLEAHPTINDELPFHIMTGKIGIKCNVDEFLENGVLFTDRTFEQIDDVIFCTGYDYRVDFVDPSVLQIVDNKTKLFKYMFPPELPHSTFAVIGLVQPIGSIIPVSEIQSRWFSRLLNGNVSLPSKEVMYQDMDSKVNIMARRYVQCRRHHLQTFWIQYMDEIASQIGCRPDLLKLFFNDPELALRCFLGPCVPAQYRLQGPGKWDGARHIICNSLARATASTRRVQSTTQDPEHVTTIKYHKMDALLTFRFYLMVMCVVFFAWVCKDSFLL